MGEDEPQVVDGRRGAQKACVITSSPYKRDLEEKKAIAQEKEDRKRDRIEKRKEKLKIKKEPKEKVVKARTTKKPVEEKNSKDESSWYCVFL